MLHRLISGAGAVTDRADRSVRALAGGSGRGFTATGPGSLVVVVILALLATMLDLAGLEATDPATPVAIAPAVIAATRDLGDRTFSTIHGSFASTYAEYFSDDNDNGTADDGEATIVWYYWLVDREARAGVTVRSTRPPEALFTFRGNGVLIEAPRYAREDFDPYEDEATRAGLAIEPDVVLDTTNGFGGDRTPVDLTGPLPAVGTPVEVSGARLASYVGICRHDASLDPDCQADQQDLFEILVFDRGSRHAIRVLVRDLPEFTADVELTGLLRREERAVDDARTGALDDFDTLDLAVSDRYVFDESAAAGSAPVAFGLAGALAGLAGIILIGLAGGYLIYRRSPAALPLPATTLGPGESIPLHVTGVLRTPTGLEHVREAPGALIRFVLGRPITTSRPSESTHGDEVGAPAVGERMGGETPLATTLIVERTDTAQGIAVGPGELRRLSSGRAITLRAPRPALRVEAGTGPLLLSFDSDVDRDRAAAELLAETGLGPDGKTPLEA
jgi:hypothetical protein